jgi:hypothetical protein
LPVVNASKIPKCVAVPPQVAVEVGNVTVPELLVLDGRSSVPLVGAAPQAGVMVTCVPSGTVVTVCRLISVAVLTYTTSFAANPVDEATRMFVVLAFDPEMAVETLPAGAPHVASACVSWTRA